LVNDKASPQNFLKRFLKNSSGNDDDDDGDLGSLSHHSGMFGQMFPPTVASLRRQIELKRRRHKSFKVNNAFDFEKMGIGGLDDVALQMFRRVFASRVVPHKVLDELGIHHVRGVLLYGPPGCGKTLIARNLCKALVGVEPIVVNGPELKSMWHGGSERNIRELFEPPAQDEEPDSLRVIILDELDAICQKRVDGGPNARNDNSEVNQFLSMMDGVKTRDRLLVIGLTNRKDAIGMCHKQNHSCVVLLCLLFS